MGSCANIDIFSSWAYGFYRIRIDLAPILRKNSFHSLNTFTDTKTFAPVIFGIASHRRESLVCIWLFFFIGHWEKKSAEFLFYHYLENTNR